MNLWRRLKEEKNWSECNQKIVNYLLAHPQKLAGLSSRELAKNAGVSAASVSRFCHKLGYEGYQELMVGLLVALESEQEQNTFSYAKTTYGIMRHVAEISNQVIAKTQAAISYQ